MDDGLKRLIENVIAHASLYERNQTLYCTCYLCDHASRHCENEEEADEALERFCDAVEALRAAYPDFEPLNRYPAPPWLKTHPLPRPLTLE